ncbi:E3 ubiquitin-protein like [Actinidia chinensis var. chinensis]|uniref:E3 ubiquitin-protein like n=1 Tax=Actinidia chinensis var. chinensis TaxID=1590841 RepID=A0A2R6P8K9_ACTCC|nr:E3 ubiquitin-protein like [Actinidia chinensis var. chinensis]
MAELAIAKSMADHLDRLQRPSHDPPCDSDPRLLRTAELSNEQLEWARLSTMTTELARSRSRATGRDFWVVLAETELRVRVELARILAPMVDPVLHGLREASLEEGGMVCGVCHDDMVFGEEVRSLRCRHVFHMDCIYRWLKVKNACPFCRYSMDLDSGDQLVSR